MKAYKIVVTGPFNAGKTTFVKTLCSRTMGSEAASLDPRKPTTTVALDFGVLKLDDGTTVKLFGTPGQERFYFMVRSLSIGMDGYVFLVDLSDPDSLPKAKLMYSMLRSEFSEVAHVVAANKHDKVKLNNVDHLRNFLNIPREYPLVPLVAYDYEISLNILKTLVSMVKDSHGVD